MYEFYFSTIKKFLGIYYCIATTCSLSALVSLKTRWQTIVSRWSAPLMLADGQALFGWSCNGVSRGGGPDRKESVVSNSSASNH